jgi:uncharacterized protein (DUF952 family)
MNARTPSEPILIYNIARRADWEAASAKGRYPGSADDRRDGFIHFSTAEQVEESCAKHRAGQPGLVLLAVEAAALGAALRWEPSRGETLFPHLYGPLPVEAVRAVHDLPLGADGRHVFPRLG